MMTYTSLIATVKAYLDRNDAQVIAQIPTFISLAHEKICRESKNIGFEVYVIGNLTSGVSVMPKPSRWRKSISFNCGDSVDNPINRTVLFLRSYEFCRSYWPDDAKTEMPKFYSDYGYKHLLISPTPDKDYPFEYCYLEMPQPLSQGFQQNWLTEFAPDLLLYAVLVQTAPYLKDDQRLPMWEQQYEKSLMGLNGLDSSRYTDKTTDREAD
jgi:hypothetical protein